MSRAFLYLSDFLQLGTYLDQFMFAVVQPGLEPLILVQSFCIHLKVSTMKVNGQFYSKDSGLLMHQICFVFLYDNHIYLEKNIL